MPFHNRVLLVQDSDDAVSVAQPVSPAPSAGEAEAIIEVWGPNNGSQERILLSAFMRFAF